MKKFETRWSNNVVFIGILCYPQGKLDKIGAWIHSFQENFGGTENHIYHLNSKTPKCRHIGRFQVNIPM